MKMLGAIIGDIVGSRFEWRNNKSKEFDFFHEACFFTDDTVMTVAIADAIMRANKEIDVLADYAVESMQLIGRPYPNCGYGGNFAHWMYSDNPKPYGSFGNGAAMRVSACGFVADSLEEVMELSNAVTEVTHNHPEGFNGAEATAVAVFMAKSGCKKEEIKEYIVDNYYDMDFTLDEIRNSYTFDVSCQGSVPQALEAFFESESFEDAIRNAISIGGDSDTIAAITGGIAEAYYGIPEEMVEKAKEYLDEELLEVVERFYDFCKK